MVERAFQVLLIVGVLIVFSGCSDISVTPISDQVKVKNHRSIVYLDTMESLTSENSASPEALNNPHKVAVYFASADDREGDFQIRVYPTREAAENSTIEDSILFRNYLSKDGKLVIDLDLYYAKYFFEISSPDNKRLNLDSSLFYYNKLDVVKGHAEIYRSKQRGRLISSGVPALLSFIRGFTSGASDSNSARKAAESQRVENPYIIPAFGDWELAYDMAAGVAKGAFMSIGDVVKLGQGDHLDRKAALRKSEVNLIRENVE
ncbi:MAG: hypothetical protein AAF226_14990 [Verrucomicrobiota bacterium]